jgi:hypothetical protein
VNIMTEADYLSTSLPVAVGQRQGFSEPVSEGFGHKGGDIRQRFRSYPYHPAA